MNLDFQAKCHKLQPTRTTVTPLTVAQLRSSPAFPPNAGFFILGGKMSKVESKSSKKKTGSERLPFTKTNYQILGAGLLVIVAGYFALSQPPWDGTMPLVVAPILLVIGYCVIIPFGILYRQKSENQPSATHPPSPNE